MRITSTGGLVALCLGFGAITEPAVAADHLERVVIVMRHGVRPPTKTAAALAPLADKSWPDDAAWGAKPGELTPRGAEAIRKLGRYLRTRYADERPQAAVIWADGADQRTRETARNLALGIAPDAPPPFGAVADGTHDPLFSGPGAGVCPSDPAGALAAARALGPVDTAETETALKRLQAIAAPNGCAGGPGPCLQGPSTVQATAKGLKIDGPVSTGASLAEDFLLEYENGLPSDQVGWGRLQSGDLSAVMATHRRESDIERGLPYIASRRAAVLTRFIVTALSEDTAARDGGPTVKAGDRMVILVGHDTNLANLGGAFGLNWSFPDQPDSTAPGTALAFERWRRADGKPYVRVRLFYTTPDQVRTLADTPPHELKLPCAPSSDACAMNAFTAPVLARIAEACPPAAAIKPQQP
ncbi:MAG TPA: histidine-type phosphatase [Caulobacteraceae bacterium]|jgi:4-phytase/acid phosphatase